MIGYYFVPLAFILGIIFSSAYFKYWKVEKKQNALHSDYFKGLGFLINDQPDKAVDVFVELLDVDHNTIEIHLALGHLFRRRGEVGRAIRVHQNIIARPNLSHWERLEALSQLGQDYLSAGVLDRAEQLFKEILSHKPKNPRHLLLLLKIYEQGKDWLRCIETAKLLLPSQQSIAKNIAHYYCEQVSSKLLQGDCDIYLLEKALKSALKYHPDCMRAYILSAKCSVLKGDKVAALHLLDCIKAGDLSYLNIVLPEIKQIYTDLGCENNYFTFLSQVCTDHQCHTGVMLELSQLLEINYGPQKAFSFLSEYMLRSPSLICLEYLLSILVSKNEHICPTQVQLLHNVSRNILHSKELFRCSQCGFSAREIFWFCPSCHHWETISSFTQ